MQKKIQTKGRVLRTLTGFSLLSLALASYGASVNYDQTVSSTDFLLGGTGDLRLNGGGSINVFNSGAAVLPGSITQAILYWGGNTHDLGGGGVANVTFNGQAVTGSFLGFAGNNNTSGWENSQAYRADVTSQLGGLASGANSFGFSVPNAADGYGEFPVNGASLLIMYDDGNVANNRKLILFSGNDSNLPSDTDPYGWGTFLSGVSYNGFGPAYLHLGVSDGQGNPDNTPTLGDDTLYLNGLPVPGANWGGPPSALGDNLTGLWDIGNFDITSYLSVGSNDVSLFTGVADEGFNPHGCCDPLYDYTSLVHGFIDLPANPVPEPTTVIGGLALASLVGARLLRRRR